MATKYFPEDSSFCYQAIFCAFYFSILPPYFTIFILVPSYISLFFFFFILRATELFGTAGLGLLSLRATCHVYGWRTDCHVYVVVMNQGSPSRLNFIPNGFGFDYRKKKKQQQWQWGQLLQHVKLEEDKETLLSPPQFLSLSDNSSSIKFNPKDSYRLLLLTNLVSCDWFILFSDLAGTKQTISRTV